MGGRSRGQEPRGFKIFKQKLHIGPLLARWPMFTNLLLLAVTAPRKRAPSLKPLGSWPRRLQKALIILLLTGLFTAPLHAAESARSPDAPSRRDVAVPWWWNFCNEVTIWNSAWHQPMNLYVSGNATTKQYDMTARAAQRWNSLFVRDVINFRGRSYRHYPSTRTLQNHISQNTTSNGAHVLANNDGWSMMYFLPPRSVIPFGTDAGWAGMASFSTRGYNYDPEDDAYDSLQIEEADMFIGPVFSSLPPYKQIALIMHEIGHALGLAHISISGNIMSYDDNATVINILRPIFMMIALDDVSIPYTASIDSISNNDIFRIINSDPEFTMFAYDSIVPQEQDKTALMCLYDFDTWGR